MTETANQDAPSPSAEAAKLVMNWQEADFRAFAFYMCGFAPTEVLYFARSLDYPRLDADTTAAPAAVAGESIGRPEDIGRMCREGTCGHDDHSPEARAARQAG